MGDVFGSLALTAGVIVGVIFLLVYAWSTRIVKVGPNEVLVVFGRKHRIINPDGSADTVGYRIVHGGRAFIWPIFEDFKILSLELFTIDIETPEVYTKQGVPIMVEGIAQIKINSDSISVRTAAEQFLNKPLNEVTAIAHQTLEGHLRAILGTMDVEEVNSNRDAFAQQVQEVAATDLANMGLGVVSFTIKDIRDNQGYLEALGKRRTAEVKRDASIGEANAMRDAEIGKAAAFQDGQVAKIKAEITVAEAEKEKRIRLAEFEGDSNTKKAEADLAYDLQKYKTTQFVKNEEVQVEIIEKTRRIELEEREIDRRRKELMATIEAPADAEARKIRTIAQAERDKAVMLAEGHAASSKTNGFAEAEVIRASGEASADAEKARGLALAEVEKARGLAEAEVVRQTGMAEAEAMEKKAAAWAQYNEAAIAQMFIEKLPEIVSAAAQPLSKVDKIVLIGGEGGGSGASRLTREVVDMVAQLPPVLESVTGLKLGDLVKSVPALKASGEQTHEKGKSSRKKEAPAADGDELS